MPTILALPLAVVALFALGGAMMLVSERYGDLASDALFALFMLCALASLIAAMGQQLDREPDRVAQNGHPAMVR